MIPRTSPQIKETRKENKERQLITFVFLDVVILLLLELLITVICSAEINRLSTIGVLERVLLGMICLFICRGAGGIYKSVYIGTTTLYMRLIMSDILAVCIYIMFEKLLLGNGIPLTYVVSIVTLNLLLSISVRVIYRFINREKLCIGDFHRDLIGYTPGLKMKPITVDSKEFKNESVNLEGVGFNMPPLMHPEECISTSTKISLNDFQKKNETFSEDMEEQLNSEKLRIHIAEKMSDQQDIKMCKRTDCRINCFESPFIQADKKDKLRMKEFDIEELLFRKSRELTDEKTRMNYQGKVILITGGGGSIGSELCKQLAKMGPKQLIILDICENGANDIQQELSFEYGYELDIRIEIMSICDRRELDKVFVRYKPDIVLHAAAHKHVPLMEHNCCEAVKNNVFGTLNVVDMAERHGVEKFILISTDKAVNPTNVMGATKRLCEMIIQSRVSSKTKFSATRFGNVLGSNGSVIPLFKHQIANGGPVTITDKRIIRYFMTIPEASQLVLQSGAMSRNGELYVLDMGKPVKILEMAENMIRLSGFEPYKDIDIVEVGLRPGEKLYEELLIKTEELDKTSNSMIFIERDKPQDMDVINRKLEFLRKALITDDDLIVKNALKRVVSTFHDPEEVNLNAAEALKIQLNENEKILVG